VQFLRITKSKPVSIAVIALNTIVCVLLITLKATVVTLRALLYKDCTMLGRVRSRGSRLVKSN
jgi:hypothetical protein